MSTIKKKILSEDIKKALVEYFNDTDRSLKAWKVSFAKKGSLLKSWWVYRTFSTGDYASDLDEFIDCLQKGYLRTKTDIKRNILRKGKLAKEKTSFFHMLGIGFSIKAVDNEDGTFTIRFYSDDLSALQYPAIHTWNRQANGVDESFFVGQEILTVG